MNDHLPILWISSCQKICFKIIDMKTDPVETLVLYSVNPVHLCLNLL